MATFDFEGREVPIRDGDSVASALYRHGVRTFTRSLKVHRRRGLYCLTGDCPNCLVGIDGVPGCRACVTPASPGQRVVRESGWPSTERDLLGVNDRLHRLMPVGFYYKTFIRPRWMWGFAERIIRRATGVGRLPVGRAPEPAPARHLRTGVLVVGAGPAGLAAALAAADAGERVTICDDGDIGRMLPPGGVRDRVRALEAQLAGRPEVTVLERHVAVGIYEGPLVPLVGPDGLVEVRPERVVVATGAVETHGVFPGNDLPGVWLGRGAARMAGVHGVAPGTRAVVVAGTSEGPEHVAILRDAGVAVVAVVVRAGADPADYPDGVEMLDGAEIVAAEGKRAVRGVRLRMPANERVIACDALILSLGLSPRDGLLRMDDSPAVVGAGDVLACGCSLEEAEAAGAEAGAGGAPEPREADPVTMAAAGIVCLCEDVGVADLEQAWREGWHSSEILKRYTTATMGPCQGAMCGRHLAAFAAAKGVAPQAGARTTSRPPARTVRLENLIGGVDEVVEKRTALHETHRAAGAALDRSGSWIRPFSYGDVGEEYRAVRERVSLMDVGTLGKTLVAGPDARRLVDEVFPCRIDDLAPGRARYLLALDEAGYVIDDGLVCALDHERYYVTSTSGGADAMEAWLRNWADRREMKAHVANQTAMLGAINVAGPRARDLLTKLSGDDLGRSAIAYPGHAEITVAGVPCRALAVGFVGELSFELHHPRSRGVELWRALMEAGADLGIRPHGLDALDILRLEKGHLYLGQDTMPDDHPSKLGLGFAVDMDKRRFVGKAALERMSSLPLERRLVGLAFDRAPQRGAPLHAGDRIVGRVTSCAWSPALDRAVGLGWLRAVDGEFPRELRAGEVPASVASTPFYDPEGVRVRG